MVLPWFRQSQPASVDDLIARKKYARAIEIIRVALKKRRHDRRLRLRLADVLILNGQTKEGVAVLNALADDVALAGNAAQAIALLKRVETLEPGRPDVEEKLAYFIRQRERPSGDAGWEHRRREVPGAEPAFDMEEIADGPELGMEEIPDTPPPPADAPAPKPAPKRVRLQPLPPTAPEPGSGEPPPRELIDAALRDELSALVDEMLSPVEEPEPGPEAPGGAAASPLFSDFSQEELVGVIRGLRLERHAPGEIVVTEGEPGDSLFVIASGSVRAFVRSPGGRNVQVRELGEGEFFGEVSLLGGGSRTATVTASAPCELLVLDRETLDTIAATHPRVREVLREFHDRRAGSTLEASIRDMSPGD